jgi:hypothetical protein
MENYVLPNCLSCTFFQPNCFHITAENLLVSVAQSFLKLSNCHKTKFTRYITRILIASQEIEPSQSVSGMSNLFHLVSVSVCVVRWVRLIRISIDGYMGTDKH